MNFERIYEYRFQGVDQEAKTAVWKEIAAHLYRKMGSPERILEPGGGRCEFLRAIPAVERWAIDFVDYGERYRGDDIRFIQGDVLQTSLPESFFDAVFVSNLLEHLPSPEALVLFLEKMSRCMKPGGRIAVLGPNFRYCADEYFDCADHRLILTHLSVAEYLYAAGLEIDEVVSRFLPYSFRGRLPPSPALTRLYLKLPMAWPIFGKQFLVLARKPSVSGEA